MKPNENQSLERILESALVVSWADLMRGAQTGLIHIEYGCGQHFGLSENRKSEIKGAVVGFRFPPS
jgi:hypothetical protein